MHILKKLNEFEIYLSSVFPLTVSSCFKIRDVYSMTIIDFVRSKAQGFLRPLSLRLVTPNKEGFSLKSKFDCLAVYCFDCHCCEPQLLSPLPIPRSSEAVNVICLASVRYALISLCCWQCQFQISEVTDPQHKQASLSVACAAVVHSVYTTLK